MKIFYAIGTKTDVTYGQGNFGVEIHICPKNGYESTQEFHPLFEDIESANKYITLINKIYFYKKFEVVPLQLNNG